MLNDKKPDEKSEVEKHPKNFIRRIQIFTYFFINVLYVTLLLLFYYYRFLFVTTILKKINVSMVLSVYLLLLVQA